MKTKTIKLTTLGLSGPKWIARLEKKKYRVSDWAKQLLNSPEYEKHRLKKGETIEVALVKHTDVGINPTTKQIQDYAKKQGYGMSTAEVALLIREALSDKQMEDMGIYYISNLHDPIKDSGGRPDVLYPNRYGGGRWVGADWDFPDYGWVGGGASAFPASKASTLEPLNLELAIKMVKEAGYKIYKEKRNMTRLTQITQMKKETQLSVLKEIRDLLKVQSGNAAPAVQDDYRTVHIPKGLTIEAALAECKTLFPVWRWTDKNLDEIITSDRTSKKAYSIKFKNVVEADKENANKSAHDLKEVKGITLLERIVMELDYFKETGQHLDIENITLCSGSRYSGGFVPSAYWRVGGFRVDWFGVALRYSSLRARVAVS